MEKYYLAIDIGASSGRHILGHMEDGKMIIEEVYRFANGMEEKNGYKVWDTERLFTEILTGMARCKECGKIPVSLGIDTWGVDFVLTDAAGNPVGETVGYRDERTKGMDAEVYRLIPEKDLYARTGILKADYNTIYQLMAVKKRNPEWLDEAEAMLMMPDYFHYRLTGVKGQEYSEATTGQLVNPATQDWDYELIDRLGYPRRLFQPIHKPGSTVGELKAEIAEKVGYTCRVVLPPTHDTQSAILAVPAQTDDFAYISSGTWSLMGVETLKANCSEEARGYNLTNEGGYGGRTCLLKNIMGLWMIQSVRAELAPDMSYGDICSRASRCTITSLVDANDDRFLAPESMTGEVQSACRETGQTVPEGIAETACVIYNSLAACYAGTLKELEKLTGQTYTCLHIVGGGSNAEYLNELTARACGVKVLAGPGEGTAIGNLTAQMIADGELSGVAEARECIRESFAVKEYV